MATLSALGAEYYRRSAKVSREVVPLEMLLHAAASYIQQLETELRHAEAIAEGIH